MIVINKHTQGKVRVGLRLYLDVYQYHPLFTVLEVNLYNDVRCMAPLALCAWREAVQVHIHKLHRARPIYQSMNCGEE